MLFSEFLLVKMADNFLFYVDLSYTSLRKKEKGTHLAI